MPRMTKFHKSEQDMSKITDVQIDIDHLPKIKFDGDMLTKKDETIEDLSFYRTCAHCGNAEGVLRNIGHPSVKITICPDCWGK